LIFAVGNIIEFLGEVFLVRVASGVLWAVSFPRRYSESSENIFKKTSHFIIGLVLLPINTPETKDIVNQSAYFAACLCETTAIEFDYSHPNYLENIKPILLYNLW
jgi:hypothetical protein